jgi:lysophospholipase L1-like esterase
VWSADPLVRRFVAMTAIAGAAAFWRFTQTPDALLWRRWSIEGFLASCAVSWVALGVVLAVLPARNARARLLAYATATLSIAVCVVVAELPTLLGHDWSVAFRLDPAWTMGQLEARVNKPDPELIHIHWPNSEFEGRIPGNLAQFGPPNPHLYDVRVRYDGNGFRNDETLERADIVAIGDSFVEGVLVAREHTVSEQIAHRVGATVANLGQSGYGFRQERIVLERFGVPLRPRVVLWFLFGGNDFRDVEEYERVRERFGLPPPSAPLRQRSFLRSSMVALARASAPPVTAPSLHTAYFRRGSGERDAVLFGHATSDPSESQWRVGTETLRAAHGRAGAIGAQFLLVYIPRKFEVYQGLLEIPPGSLVASWRDARVNERTAAWAEREGIAFLDTTPTLRAEAEAGSHPYLLDDVHWNERGHALVAEAVSARLSSR